MAQGRLSDLHVQVACEAATLTGGGAHLVQSDTFVRAERFSPVVHLYDTPRAAVATVVLALLVGVHAGSSPATVPAKTIAGDNIKRPDYTGTFAGSGDHGTGQLQIKITKRDTRGRPLKGLFQPKLVPVRCVLDGQGYDAEYRLSPYVVHFRDRGRIFEGFDASAQGGQQSVFLVSGSLTRGGAQASGEIVIIDNAGRTEGLPYCSTQGELPWSAKASE